MQGINDYLNNLYYAAIGGALFGFIAMIQAIVNHRELKKIRVLLEAQRYSPYASAEQVTWYREQGIMPPDAPQYPPGYPPR